MAFGTYKEVVSARAKKSLQQQVPNTPSLQTQSDSKKL